MIKKQFFDTIPDTILSLIFENLTLDELLQKALITTCKQFKSVKLNIVTLLLHKNNINHIPQILNHINNKCIKEIIVEDSIKMCNIHMQQLVHLHHIESFITKNTHRVITNTVKLEIIGDNFKKLKHLSLCGIYPNKASVNDWMHLLKLDFLESLELDFCVVNKNIFKRMQTLNMINLRELRLICCGLHCDHYWMDIAKLHNIEKLDIGGCNIKNEQFAYILNMHKLVYLNIAHCGRIFNLTDKDFENIINLQNLRELTLTVRHGFTDQSMKCLTNLKQLRKLNILDGSNLTDLGLLYIADIVGLQELTILRCNTITNNALDHVAKFVPKITY